jgi:RHS repeat-associated protein
VLRGGLPAESYSYDLSGRRVADFSPARGKRHLEYDRRGRLVRVGGTTYLYAADGTLRCWHDRRGSFSFFYGPGLGLKSCALPRGRRIEYLTGPVGLPLEKSEDGQQVESFEWDEHLRLVAYAALDRGYTLSFEYEGGSRQPCAGVFVHPDHGRQTLLFGCDQVGTLKVLANDQGEAIKYIDYDSFGNVIEEEWPWLLVPLGFAGGLRDRHTGLVRFGCRDYDPEVGRFTARDPLGDTGGDHDPYEYCVDDPVNAVDPTGLEEEEIGTIAKILKYFGITKKAKDSGELAKETNEVIKDGKELEDYWENATKNEDIDALEKFPERQWEYLKRGGKIGKKGVDLAY